MARTGDGMVRSHFQTRKGGDLPVGRCGECGQDTYQVPNGEWQHWFTLTSDCAVSTADPTLPLGVGSADCMVALAPMASRKAGNSD